MANNNARILVTRPAHQSASWVQRLEAAGLRTVSVSALAIVPVDDEAQRRAIRSRIQQIDQARYLIFVSQNAVQYGFDWIDDFWPQFPIGVQCFAIGAKTQAALVQRLEALGADTNAAVPQAHFIAEPTTGVNTVAEVSAEEGNDSMPPSMDSEALLQHPALQQVEGQKIIIFRGCGGRTQLFEVLAARGARVEHCELYHRAVPENALALFRQAQISSKFDVATVFSGESLSNFCSLIVQAGVAHWQHLPLLVPSARVAQQAHSLGFTCVHTAANATEAAMWDTLSAMLDDK